MPLSKINIIEDLVYFGLPPTLNGGNYIYGYNGFHWLTTGP